MQIGIKEIEAFDYILSNDSFKWIELSKTVDSLKAKYPNLMEKFTSFDGFAFPSSDYVTQYKDLENKTRLIQIGNVNETEWVIGTAQKFEFVPNSYLDRKKKYFLNKPCILLSLTGGSDLSKDISTFFDGSFKGFLNQRVGCFSLIEPDQHLMFYFYALTKSHFFKNQWLGKGGIQKNTVAKERDNTYLPLIDNKKVIEYVSVLIQSIINKEKLIQKRHSDILSSIEKELTTNQKPNKFNFNYPTINEIEEIERLDTNLYRKEFKEVDFKTKNYIHGFSTIEELGFSLSRGQNLQVSNIGKSIYSNEKHDGFYTLMLPKHLSKYGTVNEKEYLGNGKDLKTLQIGDLIFGAEGFEKGRSIVILEEREKTITNIHGITITSATHESVKSVYVKCFLDYLRDKKVIDLFAVGGNGGSLAQKYWGYIPFPNFKEDKQKEVAILYHNENANYNYESYSLDNFLEQDTAVNEMAGIYELDKSMKRLKERLNDVIDDIVNDRDIEINF